MGASLSSLSEPRPKGRTVTSLAARGESRTGERATVSRIVPVVAANAEMRKPLGNDRATSNRHRPERAEQRREVRLARHLAAHKWRLENGSQLGSAAGPCWIYDRSSIGASVA